ncbi:MAG: alpha-2-macroglobulin [Tannerella sp.]|jgi:uncharacterized protein YfaS (alpha-2-macroglobulin family)|nr:alpha-2-macroglobulin [Tannerella sp.]
MKRLTALPIVILTLCIGFVFYSCKQSKNIIPSSEYATYISGYTAGVIPANATVRIELAGEQSVVDLSAEVKEKLFDFSPSLKGKTYWLDNKTLEFVPEAGELKPGKVYDAVFLLSKVMALEDGRLDKFNFSFRVEEKNFVLKITSIDVTDSEKDKVAVNGEIRFSDTPDYDDVSKILAVKRGGESFSPIIEQSDDPGRFRFAVSGISKSDKDSQLEIKLSGKAVGIDKTVEEKVPIPASGPFKLIHSEIIETPGHGIRLTFSNPVSDVQDLTGLVSLVSSNNEEITCVSRIYDNKIDLFFDRSKNVHSVQVNIDKGLKSTDGDALDQPSLVLMEIRSFDPQVEFLSSGLIMPNSGDLILPFRAVSLYAVDLKIIRIYESNVLTFLQDNLLTETASNYLRRSGRLVYKKLLRLDSEPSKDIHNWENYSIDLSRLIKQEPGAIYRVELSFKKDYAAYPCEGNETFSVVQNTNLLTKTATGDLTEADEATWDEPQSYYYDNDIDWYEYEWSEKDNPCHPTYYMLSERKAVKNVLASDIGLIVKANSNNKLWVTVSDITNAAPIQGAEVTAYDFQLQTIGSAKTDANGFAVIETKRKPFVVIASKDKQKTYLRVADGEENQLSRFDTGGKDIRKGLKGYIYGERGVWRPGDTLHVSFMLEDRENKIPDTHPVTFELYNPRGQFYFKHVSSTGVNGLYTFDVPTGADDPTGLWSAYVKVGGASFYKSLRIETIKPNRLKINMDIPGEKLVASKRSVPVKIHSAWLTGAVAHNLGTRVEMMISRGSATAFKNYEGYNFENPVTDFTRSVTPLFEGKLDDNGDAKFDMKLPDAKDAAGMLRATLSCVVFEPGGDASLFNRSVPYSPFDAYVGIRFNLKPRTQYFETDVENVFDIATVDADGKPVNRSNLDYKIYDIGWSWWWDHSDESFASYINNTSVEPVAEGRFSTVNGKGNIKFKVDYPNWGRYLVYVKDRDGGHATGGVIYVDWPDWRGRSKKTDPSGISMLTFSTDKSSYEVGEEVVVTIPSASGGRALVAVENGSEVISREWIDMKTSGDTKYSFKVTESMTPNVYLHISMLQPHKQTQNDLPIRMYGVEPVFVTNKNSILEPQIAMDEVLRPEAEFTVKVKETKGKAMTYTLAVVDDGLLDLTNFRTPDPWNEFYAREALGIRTWDMYDLVMGAFGGKYGSLFGIGGDMEGGVSNANTGVSRFKPVVKFIGPIALKKGEEKTHKLKLPPYVGSVRVMVVAGQDGAYGNAEKTVPVRTPLMILPSLPRVVSVHEEIALPVNVFAMENSVKHVTVKVETNDLIRLADAGSKSENFSVPGDRMVYFNLKTGASTGVGKVTVTATGNGHTSTETIEINVRNPNPPVVRVDARLIEAGKSADFAYNLVGSNDEWVKMEVSRLPSIEIGRSFDFLVDYPHYCSEQLTSSALPLLFLGNFKMLDEKESATIKQNVRNAISTLYGRQLTNGGIAYWPGQIYEDKWITSYAGVFLLMAKENGYEVNPGVLTRWKNYQRKQAQSFRPTDVDNGRYGYYQYDLEQAYRLYTLALAGAPEMGAMNRLKEMKALSLPAKWRLAAAYALAGKTDIANELIFNSPTEVEAYTSNNSSYGSSYRDEAMILETLVLTGRNKEAFEQVRKVAKYLSNEHYYTTQTTACALVALGRMVQNMSGSLDFEWMLNGEKKAAVKSNSAVFRTELPVGTASGRVSITNTGSGQLYTSVVTKARPLVDTLPPASNKIVMDVSYVNPNGAPIEIDNLKQGADFTAVVRVSNIGFDDYTNLALTHIIPSGWEIYNERMIIPDEADADQPNAFTYRDIRDDRVLTYFDLSAGTTKVFMVRLMSSYAGSFVLPAVQCEAMYDPGVQARTQAGRVVVER